MIVPQVVRRSRWPRQRVEAKASFTAPASESKHQQRRRQRGPGARRKSAQRAASQPSSELEARQFLERPDALFIRQQREQKLLDELLKRARSR